MCTYLEVVMKRKVYILIRSSNTMKKEELNDLVNTIQYSLQEGRSHPPIEYDQGKIVLHAQSSGLTEPSTVQLLGTGLESISIQFDPHRMKYTFTYFGQNPYFLGNVVERHQNGLAHLEWRYGAIEDLSPLVKQFSDFELTLEETLN